MSTRTPTDQEHFSCVVTTKADYSSLTKKLAAVKVML